MLIQQQEESRGVFGRMLLNWRRRNGWTQYTACSWAEAIGEPSLVISYGNLSVIEQGKAGELRQRAFWQLWELNRRIASGDWGRIGDDAAPVWGPLEFWACYSGLRPVPPAFASTPAPLIGARQAAALSSRWRRQLQTLIEEHQLDAAAALDDLMALAGEEHPARLLCRAHRLSPLHPRRAVGAVAGEGSLPARAAAGAVVTVAAGRLGRSGLMP
ncbi:hypothetical protein H6G65_08375 [Microcystis elabens FACHB-917]|nr:hypothetical protein [Microcystis elabens FACHB-917]